MLIYLFVLWTFEKVRLRITADQRGASLVEYTFLLTFVVVIAIGSIKYFGGTLGGSLSDSGNSVSNAVRNGN